MKRFFKYMMLPVGILSVFSCQQELENPEPIVKTVTFEACFADDSTKTSYKGGGKVDWVEGDAIRYYTKKNGTINEYEVVRSGHSTKVLAEIPSGTAYMIAAYGGTEISDNGVTSFTLKGAVKATQSGKFEDAHVSVAKTFDIVDGSNLTFHNMTSLVKFSLTRTDVAYAVFKANGGESIHGNGTLNITFSDDQPSVSFGSSVGSSIRVNTNGAGEFYISTLPVKLTQGFTITLYDSSDKFLAVAEEKKAVSIGKNVVYDLGCLDGHAIVPATSVSLSETEIVLGVDSTATLVATVLPVNATDKSVIWSSSDISVASVDNTGKVSGVNAGSCTITATTKNGLKAECKVNCYQVNVTTNAASEISCLKATLNGSCNVSGAESVSTTVFFLYSDMESTLEGLKTSGTQVSSSLSGSEFSSSVKKLKYTTKYYYVAAVTFLGLTYYGEVKNFTTKSLPDGAVDLGLSVLWHQCNIGASKPSDYGRYFAWGDVVGQAWDGSSWSDGGFSTYPAYELDSKRNLKPEYDAAHVLLGGSWRMPTCAEQDELINNCTSTWTSNYNGTGVVGCIFTSKRAGYTDKSIFLPAAGFGYYRFLHTAGSYGYYWSSTFYYGYNAWGLRFDSDGVSTSYDDYRGLGRSVRPVSE